MERELHGIIRQKPGDLMPELWKVSTDMPKISPGFLERIEAGDGSRDFQAILQLRKDYGEEVVGEIDKILHDFGGNRHSKPNLFHCVLVTASPPALVALSKSDQVESIIENVGIKMSNQPRSR